MEMEIVKKKSRLDAEKCRGTYADDEKGPSQEIQMTNVSLALNAVDELCDKGEPRVEGKGEMSVG